MAMEQQQAVKRFGERFAMLAGLGETRATAAEQAAHAMARPTRLAGDTRAAVEAIAGVEAAGQTA